MFFWSAEEQASPPLKCPDIINLELQVDMDEEKILSVELRWWCYRGDTHQDRVTFPDVLRSLAREAAGACPGFLKGGGSNISWFP